MRHCSTNILNGAAKSVALPKLGSVYSAGNADVTALNKVFLNYPAEVASLVITSYVPFDWYGELLYTLQQRGYEVLDMQRDLLRKRYSSIVAQMATCKGLTGVSCRRCDALCIAGEFVEKQRVGKAQSQNCRPCLFLKLGRVSDWCDFDGSMYESLRSSSIPPSAMRIFIFKMILTVCSPL
jgi:hypothetical protein